MLKVTLVGDYPPPLGGIAVHVRQLHAYLETAGVRVRVVDIGKGARRKAAGVQPVRGWMEYAREVGLLAASSEIVHLHLSGNNAKAWAVAASLSASLVPGARRVITVHSGLMPAFARRSLAHRLMIRAALRAYDEIVAVSEGVREGLVEAGVPAWRITVHPAFLASQVRPGEPPARLQAIRARRRPLLALAHHPSPVYGRGLMFAALRLLSSRYPEVGLAVFGPGTREPSFAEAARAAGVEGLIEDLGELPHEQTLAVLQGADVFVRPTSADGDSISVREALALGVRCVASDVAPRPPGTTLFKAGDAGALCERVCEALAERPGVAEPVDAGPVVLELYRRLAAERAGDQGDLAC